MARSLFERIPDARNAVAEVTQKPSAAIRTRVLCGPKGIEVQFSTPLPRQRGERQRLLRSVATRLAQQAPREYGTRLVAEARGGTLSVRFVMPQILPGESFMLARNSPITAELSVIAAQEAAARALKQAEQRFRGRRSHKGYRSALDSLRVAERKLTDAVRTLVSHEHVAPLFGGQSPETPISITATVRKHFHGWMARNYPDDYHRITRTPLARRKPTVESV